MVLSDVLLCPLRSLLTIEDIFSKSLYSGYIYRKLHAKHINGTTCSIIIWPNYENAFFYLFIRAESVPI